MMQEREDAYQNSFASNGECGLKLLDNLRGGKVALIHSPAMANVD